MLVVIWLYNKVVVKFNELIFKLVVNGIMNFIDIYIMFRFKINYLFLKKNNDMIWYRKMYFKYNCVVFLNGWL